MIAHICNGFPDEILTTNNMKTNKRANDNKNIRHKVYFRDGGRCTFINANGDRCEHRNNLEYDHKELFCRGGRHSVENLRLVCREHNKVHAMKTLGVSFMENKIYERIRRENENIAYG